uniref:Lipocalin/cytosolic fatty-acid binding domain-containing protein n=2 Tax=Homalodisca liturata TaxID=320908 RepID=A0A1B6IL72_9HEMI
MRSYLFGAVLIALVFEAQAFFSLPHLWRCPQLQEEDGFQILSYMGMWYTQAGYKIDWVQGEGRCSKAVYNYDYDRHIVNMYSKQISSSNKWVTLNATLMENDRTKQEGKFKITYDLNFWGDVTIPYWVLGTDYNTYSVVYSCKNFLYFFHYYSCWLLSREQDLDGTGQRPQYEALVNAVLESNNIRPSTFKQIDQLNCDI